MTTLVDAGPLVAIVNDSEPDHRACVDTLESLAPPLLTTWPAVTEAMHLLGRVSGWRGQQAVWRMVLGGDVEVADASDALNARSAELMGRYADLPMDLADATLVALAEARYLRRVFTLDSDFRLYRLADGSALELLPG